MLVQFPFWEYWYFHVPNYLLATIMYTMAARFGMGLFAPADWPNYIWQGFRRLTNIPLVVIRWLTPHAITDKFLPLVGVFWFAILRALWALLFLALGWLPGLTVLDAAPQPTPDQPPALEAPMAPTAPDAAPVDEPQTEEQEEQAQ